MTGFSLRKFTINSPVLQQTWQPSEKRPPPDSWVELPLVLHVPLVERQEPVAVERERAELDPEDVILVREDVERRVEEDRGRVVAQDLPEFMERFLPLLFIGRLANRLELRVGFKGDVLRQVIGILSQILVLSRQLLRRAAVPVREAVEIIEQRLPEQQNVVVAAEQTVLELLRRRCDLHGHPYAELEPLPRDFVRDGTVGFGRTAGEKAQFQRRALL